MRTFGATASANRCARPRGYIPRALHKGDTPDALEEKPIGHHQPPARTRDGNGGIELSIDYLLCLLILLCLFRERESGLQEGAKSRTAVHVSANGPPFQTRCMT